MMQWMKQQFCKSNKCVEAYNYILLLLLVSTPAWFIFVYVQLQKCPGFTLHITQKTEELELQAQGYVNSIIASLFTTK